MYTPAAQRRPCGRTKPRDHPSRQASCSRCCRVTRLWAGGGGAGDDGTSTFFQRSRTHRTIQVERLVGRVGTVAVPGVTTGRRDEDAGVTNGTVAVPVDTRAGFACILRDAQALPHRASSTVRPPPCAPHRASSTARPPPSVRLARHTGPAKPRTPAPVRSMESDPDYATSGSGPAAQAAEPVMMKPAA
jgi:hypothetical protein